MTTPPTPEQQAAADLVGVPLNPDTYAPLPTPTPRQLALVAELLDRLDASGLDYPVATVQAILTEALVRQHGRTLRGCNAELRDAARLQEDEARRRVDSMRDGEPSVTELRPAAEHAAAAATLRRVYLYGREQ